MHTGPDSAPKIETLGLGRGVRVCWGFHLREAECEWEEYVPSATLRIGERELERTTEIKSKALDDFAALRVENNELRSKLHQLSEDHSHCEELKHELGALASSHQLAFEAAHAQAMDEHAQRIALSDRLAAYKWTPEEMEECVNAANTAEEKTADLLERAVNAENRLDACLNFIDRISIDQDVNPVFRDVARKLVAGEFVVESQKHLSKCSSCGRMVDGFGDSGFGPEYACECGSLWTGV
jgi:hypothetical protein